MLSKSSPPPLDRNPRRGQVFNLPLPTLVTGPDTCGKAFQERTVLFYISDSGASFNLKSPVAPGTRLRLAIDLPPALADNSSLKLVINGRVALVEPPEAHSDRQRISLRLDSRYIIQAEDEH